MIGRCKGMFAAAVLMAVAAAPAWADTSGLISIDWGPWGSVDGGGAFTASNYGSLGLKPTAVGGTFQTFCIEDNEYFSPSSTYQYHALLTVAAVSGGVGGQIPATAQAIDLKPIKDGAGNQYPSDVIKVQTAYLYWQFRNGTLAGWVADGDHNAALQHAIWAYEQEMGNGSMDAAQIAYKNAFTLDADANALAWALANTAKLNQVIVATLWDNVTLSADNTYYIATGNHQDMLGELPLANIEVPVPAGMWLGFSGLAMLGVGKFVRSKRQAV